MTLLLPILAVAFAAFCVWLTVRIVNRRERWAKRTLAATVGLPVLYVLSFGPACWWFSDRSEQREWVAHIQVRRCPAVYAPVGWLKLHSPRWLGASINWYATAGIDKDTAILCTWGDDAGLFFWGGLLN